MWPLACGAFAVGVQMAGPTIIAHGTDASTFLTLFEKTYHSSLKNSGIKIYKASALGGRAFAVSEAKQEELLTKSVDIYKDAMQRAGIHPAAIHVIPNGADAERFRQLPEPVISAFRERIASIATFSPSAWYSTWFHPTPRPRLG